MMTRAWQLVLALLAALLLLILVNPQWFPVDGAERAEYTARVVRIVDVDTYLVEIKEPVLTGFGGKAWTVTLNKIRLYGVDGPEKDQPWGIEARAEVEELLLGQTVKIRPTGKKSFNRYIAAVILQPCGTNLAVWLVRGGYAWPARKYFKSSETDEAARLAAEEGQGLWGDPNPTPPWLWRWQKRNKKRGK